MKIEIVNLQTVKFDGVIYGTVAEAASRLPSETANIQSALEAYAQAGEDAKANASNLQQKLNKFVSLSQSGDADGLKNLITDFTKTDRQKEIDAITADISEKQKQIAALTGADSMSHHWKKV